MYNWVMLDMRNDNAIVSVAMMQVLKNKRNMDYLDILMPFIKSVLPECEGEIVIVSDVADKVNTKFGINILDNVVEILFRRLRNEQYLKREKGVYIRQNKKVEINEFNKIRSDMFKNQNKIYDAFRKYILDYFGKEIEQEQAKNYLLNFLQRYVLQEKTPYNFNNITENDNYHMGMFINHLYEEKDALVKYLENMVEGILISNAIFLSINNDNKNSTIEKVKNLSIYLDTTFLVFALDLANEKQTRACKEFMELAKQHNITFECFRHNVDEVENILRRCIEHYNDISLRENRDLDFFIMRRHCKADLELEYLGLERNLTRIGVTICETPEYDKDGRFVIGEVALGKYLDENIRYNSPRALDNDVASIASIYRLRKNGSSNKLETCKHLFVTTNESLAYWGKQYLTKIEKMNGYTPILTDIEVTSLLWLKTPILNERFISDKLIADAYAAVQPSKEFWQAYIIRVKELDQRNDITIDLALDLRSNEDILQKVMSDTSGDSNKMASLNLDELVDYARKVNHKEIVEQKEIAETKIVELEDQLNNMELEHERKRDEDDKKRRSVESKLFQHAEEKAKKYKQEKMRKYYVGEWIIAIVFFGALGVSCYFNYVGWLSLDLNVPKVGLIPFGIIASLVTIIGGGFILNLFRKFNKWYGNKVYNKAYVEEKKQIDDIAKSL